MKRKNHEDEDDHDDEDEDANESGDDEENEDGENEDEQEMDEQIEWEEALEKKKSDKPVVRSALGNEFVRLKNIKSKGGAALNVVLGEKITGVALPGLVIDEIGLIYTPLPPGQANEIFEKIPTEDPTGHSRQIFEDKLNITNPNWTNEISKISAQVKAAMAITNPFNCKFHKLVLCESGGKISTVIPEAEKNPNIFGTLVYSLPATHEGGQLNLTYSGKETVFDFAGDSSYTAHFAAFFNALKHEFKPITSGYSLSLVYHLIHDGVGAIPALPSDQHTVSLFADNLKAWRKTTDNKPKLFAFVLENQYKKHPTKVQELIGADKQFAKTLQDAAAQEGNHFEIYLARYKFTTSYLSDEAKHDCGNYSDDEDDDTVNEYLFNFWNLRDGNKAALQHVDLTKADIIPEDYFIGKRPCGAEGGRDGLSPVFIATALVIWPKWSGLLNAGETAAAKGLAQMISNKKTPTEDILDFANLIIDSIKLEYYGLTQQNPMVDLMVNNLIEIGESKLAEKFVDRLKGFHSFFHAQLLRLTTHYKQEEGFLSELIKNESDPNSQMAFFYNAVHKNQIRNTELLLNVASKILDNYSAAKRTPRTQSTHVPFFMKALRDIGAKALEQKVGIVAKALEQRVADQVVEKAGQPGAAEDTVNVLKYSIQLLENARSLPWVHIIYQSAKVELQNTIKSLQHPPTGIVITPFAGCTCSICAQVHAFMRDPNRSVYEFIGRGIDRNHVQTKNSNSDITFKTERELNKITLTKTPSTWKLRQQDKKEERLLVELENVWNGVPDQADSKRPRLHNFVQ